MLVLMTGIEPASPRALRPKRSVYTYFHHISIAVLPGLEPGLVGFGDLPTSHYHIELDRVRISPRPKLLVPLLVHECRQKVKESNFRLLVQSQVSYH